ncbi:hypothetical protein BC938DRAFT_481595, partial [Jimgerdemannia flammicorona]
TSPNTSRNASAGIIGPPSQIHLQAAEAGHRLTMLSLEPMPDERADVRIDTREYALSSEEVQPEYSYNAIFLDSGSGGRQQEVFKGDVVGPRASTPHHELFYDILKFTFLTSSLLLLQNAVLNHDLAMHISDTFIFHQAAAIPLVRILATFVGRVLTCNIHILHRSGSSLALHRRSLRGPGHAGQVSGQRNRGFATADSDEKAKLTESSAPQSGSTTRSLIGKRRLLSSRETRAWTLSRRFQRRTGTWRATRASVRAEDE